MKVPAIDFSSYNEDQQDSLLAIGNKLDSALSEIGFMSISNLGISVDLRKQVFAASREFFRSDESLKSACAYVSAAENFGYQGLCEEHLDPGKPADIKETFTMRNLLQHPGDDKRWPSPEFRDLMISFYQACLEGAYKVQRVMASTLDVAPDFFVKHHNGENISLRLLYYPASGVDQIAPDQLGAGAHTDYGLLTLLFQDNVGGLEVLDMDNQWQAVDCEDSAIVMNSGDLLERWTNGRYRSTLHRVKPKIGQRERFSVVMFVDPDSATSVSVLDSCTSESKPARYETITAGEHVQQRIQASHNGNFPS